MMQDRSATARRRDRLSRSMLAALLALLMLAAPRVLAADLVTGLEGRWVAAGEPSFSMTWSQREGGFVLRWTVPGQGEREATFVPTARPGMLAARDERGWSMFGRNEPVNPLVGGTLYWARLADDAVHVYSLAIDDEGAFVLDHYACRPAGDNLEVAFQRRLPGDRVEERAMTLTRATP